MIAACFAEPPPSQLYGAPSSDLQTPTGGADYSGMFSRAIHVPSTEFQAPLLDTLDTYQPESRQRIGHSLRQYEIPANTYGPPENTYLPPTPKDTYLPPPTQTYGPPQTSYLPPRPTKPAKTYIPPRTTPRTVYIPAAPPRNTYGPPAAQQQQTPNRLYGAPAVTGAVFPSNQYGPPARDQPSSQYGAPANNNNNGYNYGGNDDFNNVSKFLTEIF